MSTSSSAKLADGAERALSDLGLELDESVMDGEREQVRPRKGRPRWLVPTLLLLATLLSMTWAGIAAWSPADLIGNAYASNSLFEVRRHVLANWIPGLVFSISLTVILGAHELGHYFASRYYRIQSSLPIFIPFPISPTGTCGAVILMEGFKADRKQIFDIGIAGPLAGLVFAIPMAAIGLTGGSPPQTRGNSIHFGQPIAIQLLASVMPTQRMENDNGDVSNVVHAVTSISNEAMSPMLMAAWVGLLVTGLNMVPISQLDGGHVIFGLFGRRSRPLAWLAYLGCIGYVIYTSYRFGQPEFILMLFLIPLMGIAHPPSRNDFVEIGLPRQILGAISLTIPFLCIPLRPVVFL